MEKLVINTALFNGKIKEHFGTQENFAKELNLSSITLRRKLNNITEFTINEFARAIKLLHLEEYPESKLFL